MGQLQWWGTRYGGVGVALSFPPDACSGQAAKLLFPWEGRYPLQRDPGKRSRFAAWPGPSAASESPLSGRSCRMRPMSRADRNHEGWLRGRNSARPAGPSVPWLVLGQCETGRRGPFWLPRFWVSRTAGTRLAVALSLWETSSSPGERSLTPRWAGGPGVESGSGQGSLSAPSFVLQTFPS